MKCHLTMTPRKKLRFAGWTLLLLLAQLILFKVCYPHGDYGAEAYANGRLWPAGYAWFLRLFHLFTYSETALVVFQYLFLELSALYLYWTIVGLFGLGKPWSVLLYLFLFVNPLFLYLANVIGGEALFAGVSLLWTAQLCRMLRRPRRYHVVTMALLVGLAFSLRYDGFCYLLITILAFFYANYRFRVMVFGILLSILVVMALKDRAAYFGAKTTGLRQFPALDSRQAASDVLYMYPHIRVDSEALPNNWRLRPLNRVVRQYVAGNGVNSPDSLLRRYAEEQSNPEKDGYKAWARVKAVFAAYGTYLVRSHPGAFIRYCFLPDSRGYLFPALGPLGAHKWLTLFSVLFSVFNILYLMAVAGFLATGGERRFGRPFTVPIALITILLIVHFCFSVYASPVELGGQVFVLILEVAFGLVLVHIIGLTKTSEK